MSAPWFKAHPFDGSDTTKGQQRVGGACLNACPTCACDLASCAEWGCIPQHFGSGTPRNTAADCHTNYAQKGLGA